MINWFLLFFSNLIGSAVATMNPSVFPVREIPLLLFILNKSFLLFLCLFHCLFFEF